LHDAIMNKVERLKPLADYAEDFARWSAEQAMLIRAGRLHEVDLENVAEEIESLGRNQKREIRSQMKRLLMHLLKWHYQPSMRSHSWQSSISGARDEIGSIVDDSPSLRSFPSQTMAQAFEKARQGAASETKLEIGSFPMSCPYSIEQILDYAFYPGTPWSPDDLNRD